MKNKFSTRCVHSGQEPSKEIGEIVTPIYQTSTFVFSSAEEGKKRFEDKSRGYIYTRLGNPTTYAFEKCIADLEGGKIALSFSSGMAAIAAVVAAFTKKGDNIVATDALYGCTHDLLTTVFTKYGVTVDLIDTSDLNLVKKSIKQNTKILFLETPANPTMKLSDIKAISEITKQKGVLLVVDNTFATPYIQRPLELGADISLHSVTKYIGGHSDLIAGAAIFPNIELFNSVYKYLIDFGGVIDPFAAWLALRGLKTLPLRMEKCCENTMKIASFLEKHPKVKKVYYPGLKSFPQYKLAKKQMDAFGGMLSFEIKGGYESGVKFLDSVKLCSLAVSLGAVETLIQHPASMTHAGVPREDRLKEGITDTMIRLSVGIEDADDIINDLKQAFEKI